MTLAAFATLVAAGALIASLAASALPQTLAAETYADKAGDATPDITTVTVRHDGNGVVALAVTAVGTGSAPASGNWQGISLFVEPDDDSSPAATPYSLDFEEWATGTACLLHKDNGTSYMPVPSSVSCTKSGDTVTWSFPKNDIGAGGLFSFFVVAWQGTLAGQVLGQDRAPDFGRWGYYFTAATTSSNTTTTPPPALVARPVIGKPTATPSTPRAGSSFAVTFPVTRSDTRAPLTVGTMRCDPTIAGRLVSHSEQFKAGKARVSIRVPGNAKGKQLLLRLTISSNGHSTSRLTVYRVATR